MRNNLFFYSDVVPIEPEQFGTGLARVNHHIVKALQIVDENVFSPNLDFQYSTKYIGVYNNLLNLFPRTLKTRLNDEDNYFKLFLKLTSELSLPQSEANIVFCAVGSKIENLRRAQIFGNLLGARVIYYLVDDFENQDQHKVEIETVLSKAFKVFTITENLRDHFRVTFNLSNIRSLDLPFNFKKEKKIITDNSDYLIFAGNTGNHYQDGLIELCETIVNVNKNENKSLYLRLTTSKVPPYLVKFRNIIKAKKAKNPFELEQLLQHSRAGFVAVSSNPDHTALSTRSFPSKILEKIAYCPSLILGGTAAGIGMYRNKINLKNWYIQGDNSELRRLVISPQNTSSAEREIFRQIHSYDRFRARVYD